MQLTYPVSAEFDGKELLCLLRHLGLSTTMIRRLKHSDGIRVDGHSVTVRHRLTAGQTVTLTLPEPPSNVRPVAMDLEIVYEDDWLLVVNKPSGMPTHPSAGHREDTLANGLAYYLQNTPYTAHPITRLDRYTGGLTLFAKNPVAAADLCRQAKEGQIEKIYYAITSGIPHPPVGSVDRPIGRAEGSVITRRVREDGRPALTLYETVAVKNGQALVKAKPITGRTHQIRVHMASIGCPLTDDFLYGQERAGKIFRLTCFELGFVHPLTKKRITIKNPSKLPNFD